MAQQVENKTIDDAVELLKTHGFDGLAEAVTVLMIYAMVAERSEFLGAAPYQRSSVRSSITSIAALPHTYRPPRPSLAPSQRSMQQTPTDTDTIHLHQKDPLNFLSSQLRR